jgi:hypothetical protein
MPETLASCKIVFSFNSPAFRTESKQKRPLNKVHRQKDYDSLWQPATIHEIWNRPLALRPTVSHSLPFSLWITVSFSLLYYSKIIKLIGLKNYSYQNIPHYYELRSNLYHLMMSSLISWKRNIRST